MSVNPALAGQNVSQPVREEWLDPTELHPLHQALIDQVSKQRGPRVHRLSPFMERAKAGMDSMTILKDSYDRKTKAVEAQTAMVLDPNLQYAAQGLPTPEEQLAAGMPLGAVAPGAPSGGPVQPARPGDPSGGPLGPAVPTAQTVQASPLDGQEYGRISAELGGIRRPEYPGEAPLNDPPLEQVIGAAVLGYLTKNPRLATLPLEAQVFDQQRRTKEGLAAYGAESRAAEDRISTLERMLGVQSGRDVDAARRADDAAQFNAREANDLSLGARGQDMAYQRNLDSIQGRAGLAQIRADNQEKIALIRATSSANPQTRADAASRLKLRFGFDIYDPAAYSALTPGERAAAERAKSLEAKRPHEIAEIVARTGLTKERAALVHEQVEHFDEGLRIKAAMLQAYLANVDSMIAERARRPELEADKAWLARRDDQVKRAEKELDGIKARRDAKADELSEYQSTVDSAYGDPSAQKFYADRVSKLQSEVKSLDELIDIAEADLRDAMEGPPGPIVDPLKVDPGLKGPIGRRRLRSVSGNPYSDVV